MLGIYTYSTVTTCYQRVCFTATPVRQTTAPLDSAIVSSHWLSREQIQSSALRSPLVMQAIDDFEAGERTPLSVVKTQL